MTGDSDDKWVWDFKGFESESEGRPVQRWFDDLPDEAKEEIVDLVVRYLRIKTKSRWQRPSFDPLEGSCGISELIPRNITMETDRGVETLTYRIYGFFGPGPHVYTFLHGTRKDVKNDEEGKRVACRRLDELRRRRGATVHTFRFEEKPDEEALKGHILTN